MQRIGRRLKVGLDVCYSGFGEWMPVAHGYVAGGIHSMESQAAGPAAPQRPGSVPVRQGSAGQRRLVVFVWLQMVPCGLQMHDWIQP